MNKVRRVEIFMPPNVLKAKMGGINLLDVSTIRRAERAIEELREEFVNWIAEDVNRLITARTAFESSRSPHTLGALYRASHDLKGQGATFEFPLVARIASSLCRLTDEESDGTTLPMHLIDTHVDAIRVIVRDGIKGDTNALAGTLAAELEQRVREYRK